MTLIRRGCLILLFSAGLAAQNPPAAAPAPADKSAGPKQDIQEAWDQLLQGVIPQVTPDKSLVVPQAPVQRGAAGDFLNHFYFESRTEYVRQEISFTGLPTSSGVIDAPTTGAFNPNGIPFRDYFKPNSDQLYSLMNWGTRGWLSPRIDTNFSFRYRTDLNGVPLGANEQNILNTFGASRRLELLTGTVEIKGQPGDGMLAGTSLKLGRQTVYAGDLASFDGASFYVQRRRFQLTLFGGRRFSYFSDPEQRAIAGGSLLLNLGGNASLEYEANFYIKGSHTVTFRKRFPRNVIFNTFFKVVGGSPVDYSAQAMYLPGNGKSTFRLSYFQKLSNRDFFYDPTFNARDLDSFNTLQRLYLGPIPVYSQVMIDARREIFPRLRVGGTVWIRRLNDFTNDQSPFATSFNDYRINVQAFPVRRTEFLVDLHQRNADRSNPLGHVLFDDVSIAGETQVQDLTAQLRRSFAEGRVVLSGGGFYRQYNFQDRFYFINSAHVKGLVGSASYQMDRRTRLYADWSLDNDFYIFRPAVQHAQVLRLGMNWKY